MNMTRRQCLFSALGASAALAQQPETWRGQIGGEWCFIKKPGRPNGAAVITLHGAGEWVSDASSSWETQSGANALLDALVAAGFLVAQSNSGARNGNGMWGNTVTQSTTAALVDFVRTRHQALKVHALAVSAGNLVLANLLLTRKASFDKAVLLAPCLSLASEYKCPGGVNRVKTIAEAYGFRPASGCPGDPVNDSAFVAATGAYDPARIWDGLSNRDFAAAFGHTEMLAGYETGDPRVPPRENILAFAGRLRACGIPLRLLPMESDTHGSQELFTRNQPAILQFLGGQS